MGRWPWLSKGNVYAEVVVNLPIVRRSRHSLAHTSSPPAKKTGAGHPAEAENSHLAVTFHYHLPTHLEQRLQVGHLVAVPFRIQQLTAVVVALSESSPVEETKPVIALLDEEPVLTEAQIRLAYWLSAEYLAPLADCVRLFLPPGSRRKPRFVLEPTTGDEQHPLNAPEKILLTYLRQHGAIPLEEVDTTAAEALIEKGLARQVVALSKPWLGPKMERMVELLIPPDEVEAVLPTLGRDSRQADLLLYLVDLDDPLPALADVLERSGCSRAQAKALVEKGWVELIPAERRQAIPPAQQPPVRAAIDSEEKAAFDALIRSEPGQAMLRYLIEQPQPVLREKLLAATGAGQNSLNTLEQKGLVTRFEEPERIILSLDPADVTEAVIKLRYAQKQADVLHLLVAEDGPVWIGWVYAQTDATLQTLRSLVQADLISMGEARHWRDPLAEQSFTLDTPPTLTEEQRAVWAEIDGSWQPGRLAPVPVLLHGVTGSGKTEIYLRAVAAALQAGQGAIILVPEITLAAQMVRRVLARFPDRVALWHSALSPGERFDTWERVRSGELPIVVGPRSALFAPVPNRGTLVVDEEPEPVYKQRDRTPAYHGREAALKLGHLAQALVVMGSATPDVVSYRKAERGEYRLLSLPNRILAHTGHLAVQQALLKRVKGREVWPGGPAEPDSAAVSLPLPPVEVVDLREELKAGNRTIFSRSLQAAIGETLGRGEQVILFLNRRGTASFVICRDCGFVMRCPRCDTTLTYHASGQWMVCHYCGYLSRPRQRCPECDSQRIRYFGLGTQRVEEAVAQMFPQARTLRWDWDTTRRKGSHAAFLEHFIAGRANVMVGTQMVAKGLDLPLVTLVGVISADTALYLPDFRAAERTFQLLMQVAGRAGRSPLGGRVIVQSYNPDRVAIEAAAHHDYEGFYRIELAFRREQRYPPFKRLALLLYSGLGPERSASAARQMARRLTLHIERWGLPAVEIIGPTPGYVQRVGNQYRWHILVRAYDPPEVLRPLMPLPPGWRVDVDPVTLL